ncbi:hypothetical protein F9288_00810 [Sphingomonas sp. CL5.1]|uniref:hypothetical protein n=1 Tax=Sphingomonas sp. CL5.1 TaxID=2653203 RepID=UPI0015831BF3|nr:hypothetical protein [Sphingomonas sp. CL5.1]QKR98345.1 hypothetical protein F9288_00810 [Sphingomonas sp. CL5.1]
MNLILSILETYRLLMAVAPGHSFKLPEDAVLFAETGHAPHAAPSIPAVDGGWRAR